ncbi:winged helix-turn-helix domain-containing protein [Kitasatospora aureofaciens]|uniref:winged helix-turn-helix domain-containing protein n=1 Tax=Kitasatospora aureofaciens TaxID=1894 RepID=UPI001C4763E6|nr:winged helix-turn-helix domain-containing protein [Kitasatospora aureofaciens]MBV6695807.1 winged helix-turn-helix domain-containing protein [Kitasatospora aureofaciens]
MAVRYPRLDVIFSDYRAVARVAATAPASTPVPAPAAPVLIAGPNGLAIDPEQRLATVDGREVEFTFMEFELLAHLVAHPLRVHSRRQLMENVWGRPDNGDTRTISTHIARIRRKLGPEHGPAVATVRQIGYKYDPRLTAAA